MIEQNPIALGRTLEKSVRRYLQAALPISPKYPHLRDEVARSLEQKELLLKGPFVETLPDFEKGASLTELIAEGKLHTDFAKLDERELTRPLHRHQADAIEAITARGENVIVATGTGSGKTECFLYPILDALLREK